MCDLDLALHLADAHKVVLFNTDFEKQKVFGCSSCVAKFSTRELAVEHVTRKHSGISDPVAEKYNCSYCNLTMNKKNFRSHLVRCVILSGQLRCRFCLVKIDNKELLQQHMTTKHPTEEDSGLGWTTKSLPFGCPVCQKAFPSDEAVLCHAQIKHPLRIRKNAPPVPLETTLAVTHNDGMTYNKCPFCKYTTPMLSLIMKHIFAKHKDRKDEISDPISIGMTQGSSQGTSSNCTSLGKRPLVSEKPSPPGASNRNAYMSEKRFRSGPSASYKARPSRANEASGFAKSVNQYRATKSYDSRDRTSYRGTESRISPWLADTSPGYESRPYKAVVQSGAVVGFECVVCGQSYLSHAALDMHMKVNH